MSINPYRTRKLNQPGLAHRFLLMTALMLVVSALGCASQPVPNPAPVNAAPAANPDFDYSESTHQSRAGIKQGAGIRIDNPWGDVRVRNHDDGRVKAQAAIQRIGTPRPAPPQIELTESADGVEIAVSFPEASLEPRTGRVDLVVFVPADKSLEVNTADGHIEIKKTRNSIVARSGSGQILVLNEGQTHLTSKSGEIHLRPTTRQWGSITAQSESGLIAAFVPETNNLAIEVAGASELTGEFELSPTDQGWFRQWGAGSERVTLISQGPVKIYRVFLPPEELAQENN